MDLSNGCVKICIKKCFIKNEICVNQVYSLGLDYFALASTMTLQSMCVKKIMKKQVQMTTLMENIKQSTTNQEATGW